MQMLYWTSLAELLIHSQDQLPLMWGAILDVQSSLVPVNNWLQLQAKTHPAEPSQPQNWERQS